jgi:hypothetical protein
MTKGMEYSPFVIPKGNLYVMWTKHYLDSYSLLDNVVGDIDFGTCKMRQRIAKRFKYPEIFTLFWEYKPGKSLCFLFLY